MEGVLDTDALSEAYHEQGWVYVPELFSALDIAGMRSRVERLVDGAVSQLEKDGLLSNGTHSDQPFGRRLMALIKDAGVDAVMPRLHGAGSAFGVAKALGSAADEMERPIFDMVAHNRLLDVLETLMGPKLTYSYAGIMRVRLPDCTEDSRSAKPFPFHQDTQYFDTAMIPGGKPSTVLGGIGSTRPVVTRGQAVSSENLHIITVWVPLVDTDETNGALTLISGSHRWGMLDGQRDEDGNMRAFNLDDRERVNQSPKVVQNCPAGGAILFNNLCFHGSGPNLSDSVRWSFDWRYDAHTAQQPALKHQQPQQQQQQQEGARARAAALEWWRGQFSKPGRLDYGPFLVRDRAASMDRPSWKAWVERRCELLRDAGVEEGTAAAKL